MICGCTYDTELGDAYQHRCSKESGHEGDHRCHCGFTWGEQ